MSDDYVVTIKVVPVSLLEDARGERDCLLAAIDELRLWDSRRAGFAAALSRLMAVADEIRSKATPA